VTKSEKFAWVAGLLEGEGCFKMHPTNKKYVYPQIEVNMADEDIVRRLREFTGVGNVQGPYSNPKKPHHSPMWRWTVQRSKDATDLMERLLPFMGVRRATKIGSILNEVSC